MISSATEPVGLMRLRPAMDRLGRFAGAMTPSLSSRASNAAVSIGITRAIGNPRSVTTISSPARTRSNHALRFARSVVTGTSMRELYVWRYRRKYVAPRLSPRLPGD